MENRERRVTIPYQAEPIYGASPPPKREEPTPPPAVAAPAAPVKTAEAPATAVKDVSAGYIDKSMDLEGLAGDITDLVTRRIQTSMPDERKLMLDLVAQVGELNSEVRQLRKQLENSTYVAMTCPSGQMRDLSAELAEIRGLLETEPHQAPPAQTAPRGAAVPPAAPQPVPQSAPQRETVEQAFAQPRTVEILTPPPPKKKKKALSIIGNILFYVLIVALVLGAFMVKSGSGGQPTLIAGYSAFTVLSSSMEDTYPKGSLIVTRSVDANELEVGDDITYMASATSSITHRIIGITENYLDTGARAFETQGTMNANPDKEPVAAANVVGQVIFCSPLLGQAATFVGNNWPILLFFVAVLSALIAFLRWNFRREEPETKPRKRPA